MKNPFEDMGKKVRNTVVSVAALGITATEGLKAQNNPEKNANKTEQVASTKTSWMKETISSAKAELKYIQTKEDAEEFVLKWTQPFIEKIGVFSAESAGTREGGITLADEKAGYSLDDYQYMLKEFTEFGKVIDSLEKKYNFKRGMYFKTVSDRLTQMSSYKNYNEAKRLAKYMEEN